MNGVAANQKIAIALVTGLKSLKQITSTVKRETKEVRRYGLCKPGDLRHCWAIRAMGFIPDSMAARMMAHKTQVHNDTYKRWIDENDEDRFYQLLINRSDRPKPPTV